MVASIITADARSDKYPEELRSALARYRHAARLVAEAKSRRRGRAELERLVVARYERRHELNAVARLHPLLTPAIWAEVRVIDGNAEILGAHLVRHAQSSDDGLSLVGVTFDAEGGAR